MIIYSNILEKYEQISKLTKIKNENNFYCLIVPP